MAVGALQGRWWGYWGWRKRHVLLGCVAKQGAGTVHVWYPWMDWPVEGDNIICACTFLASSQTYCNITSTL